MPLKFIDRLGRLELGHMYELLMLADQLSDSHTAPSVSSDFRLWTMKNTPSSRRGLRLNRLYLKSATKGKASDGSETLTIEFGRCTLVVRKIMFAERTLPPQEKDAVRLSYTTPWNRSAQTLRIVPLAGSLSRAIEIEPPIRDVASLHIERRGTLELKQLAIRGALCIDRKSTIVPLHFYDNL